MALVGIKVVEFGGLAPGPFAGLILADNGASVTRIDRLSVPSVDILSRGKRSLAINSKTTSGLAILRKLIASADVVIDPFRPGVLERLGLGPEVFHGNGTTAGVNERLIFGRIVGFPTTGAQKDMAGHDINYLALSGILSMLPGGTEKPTFPLNLVADFAGGGLMLALGIMLALVSRQSTGRGQVVNTDMVSGTRYLSSFPLIFASTPGAAHFGGPRMTNLLDGGAPFYDVYTCSDGQWMSVGCLEPQFYAAFIDGFVPALPRDFTKHGDWLPTPQSQTNRAEWPRMRDFFQRGFRTNTRDYWAAIFHKTDACALPVLTIAEAGDVAVNRSPIPAPHPLVSPNDHDASRGKEALGSIVTIPGQHSFEILQELGLTEQEWTGLATDKALGDEFRYPSLRNRAKL